MAYFNDMKETFVSASTEASLMLEQPNALINTITVDNGNDGEGYKSVGDTVKYVWALVNKANATNIGSGDHSPVAVASNSASISLDTKLSSSRVVRSFDQTKSGVDNLINFALKPAIEEVLQQLNSSIGALMVSANFTVNTSITGGADTFTRANLTKGYYVLRGKGVPIKYGDVFFATSGTVVANMADSDDFYHASVIGDEIASNVTVDALPAKFCHTIIVPDDDVPVPSTGVYNGLMYHRGAIVARTAYEQPLGSEYIHETWVNARNIPVHVTIGPDQLKSGWLVTASALLGLAVVRPEMAQIYASA